MFCMTTFFTLNMMLIPNLNYQILPNGLFFTNLLVFRIYYLYNSLEINELQKKCLFETNRHFL